VQFYSVKCAVGKWTISLKLCKFLVLKILIFQQIQIYYIRNK